MLPSCLLFVDPALRPFLGASWDQQYQVAVLPNFLEKNPKYWMIITSL